MCIRDRSFGANFVKFGRPEVGEIARCLMDKKKQNFGSRSRCRFCADRAQNMSGTAPSNILGVSKFHPNPFTSGGVIAERVNNVQTRHKVFAILGEASASSPSKNWRNVSNTPGTWNFSNCKNMRIHILRGLANANFKHLKNQLLNPWGSTDLVSSICVIIFTISTQKKSISLMKISLSTLRLKSGKHRYL